MKEIKISPYPEGAEIRVSFLDLMGEKRVLSLPEHVLLGPQWDRREDDGWLLCFATPYTAGENITVLVKTDEDQKHVKSLTIRIPDNIEILGVEFRIVGEPRPLQVI
ncbi:MAG: hypothetical protein DRJ67_04110 [Thermoprotei archaeon]|nr:MAG: hypothetical protein DRJ67_04110 [Thermoprotei archaeon]